MLCMLATSWMFSGHFASNISAAMQTGTHHTQTLLVLSSIILVFTMGFIIYEVAKPTVLPSFVLAILFGIVSRDMLSMVVENHVSLTTLITVGAVLILFDGGLDMPFTKFRSLLGPICSLAFIGTILNAFLLTLVLSGTASWFGIALPLAATVLLGAAIASTDPAAIIPCLENLQFRKPRVKHIAISESAINDVVGAVLVSIFLGMFLATQAPLTIWESYAVLVQWENALQICITVLMGVVVGLVGFAALHLWSNWKQNVMQSESGTDAALFLAVPLFAFTLAEVLGGSGFLAAFLVGLFFHVRVHFRHIEHYFNHTVEGFMKPMIFMLLGAMVNPADMIHVAGLGITVGLLFIFVLRPIIVFATLAPFMRGKHKLSLRELGFLSFVRETGVIPAALLITITIADIPGSETMMAIGLWVILLTLIIQPPCTPFLAKKLGVAVAKPELPKRMHHGPVAVLCSRGYSFPERMQTVVEWALQHSVENIALLHCPEEKYSKEFVDDVRKNAEALFKKINQELEDNGKETLNFEMICGEGSLQDNIETMIAEGDVSIIFVGSKMLDYRLKDVKRLEVPFFFMS